MRIHHLGIAVESLAKAEPIFELLLGTPPESRETVEDQKVRVSVFRAGGDRIELLEASAPDSPIGRFIAKRGPGIHHVAIEVEDVAQSLAELERRGVRLIDREARSGAEQESIAFIHPSSTAGVLIELVQARKHSDTGEKGRE